MNWLAILYISFQSFNVSFSSMHNVASVAEAVEEVDNNSQAVEQSR